MATTNLFQTLYNSAVKNYVNAGYTCDGDLTNNAEAYAQYGVDENNNPVFEILDAGGNTIASQNLGDIIAQPVYEYESKTKVLQPNSCYFVQGPEFGESYMTEYFKICKELIEAVGWENYVNIEFDITYSCNFGTVTDHYKSDRPAGDITSILTYIQNWFDCMDIPVNIDEEDKEDLCGIPCGCASSGQCNPNSKDPIVRGDLGNRIYSYIRFMGTQRGYNFVVRNLRVYPIFASEDFPYSPFSPEQITVQDIIQAIRNVKPYRIDATEEMNPYLIDCSLYLYVLTNLDEGLRLLDDYKDLLPSQYDYSVYAGFGSKNPWYNIDPDELLNTLYYPYDSSIADSNDIIHRGVYPIFEEIFRLTGLRTSEPSSTEVVHKLFENLDLRIESLKYPNGAFRGISVVPQYPAVFNAQALSLKLNIIKDKISLYFPVWIDQLNNEVIDSEDEITPPAVTDNPDIDTDDWTEINVESKRLLWQREDVFVLAGSNILTESLTGNMKNCHCGRMDIDYTQQFADADNWAAGTNPSKDYTLFYKDTADTWANAQDPHWKDNRLIDGPTRVIGMYGYISEVDKRQDWINVGQVFTLISNTDAENDHCKNLCNSIFIYNPNPFPIKINILVFS